MKQLLLLVAVVTGILMMGSCRPSGIATPYRAYNIPEYKTKKHYGLRRKTTIDERYRGKHRFGPRVHHDRGRYRGM